jgi:DNA-binding beta-propeller fold protein YncE
MAAQAHTKRFTRLFYLASSLVALAACKKTHAPHADPVPIAAAHAAYVTNNGSDTIAAIDRDGDAVVMRSVDIDPSAHEAPHHLAVDGAGHVFVALAFPPDDAPTGGKHAGHGGSDSVGALLRLDQRTLGVEITHDVDQNPGDVVLTHDQKRVLVTHFDMRRAMQQAKAAGAVSSLYARLVVLDSKTLEELAARAVCVAPHGIAITADDATAVIACYGSDEIALVDLRSHDLPVAHVPIAQTAGVPGAPRFGPYSVAIAPDQRRVLVADLESADVRVLDLAARELVADSAIPLGARAMMPDFVSTDVALVPLQGPDGLVRVDLAKGSVVARVAFGAECQNPHVARVASDGRAYVVCEGDHKEAGAVVEIDPVTLATKRRWVVGVYPDGIAFSDQPKR